MKLSVKIPKFHLVNNAAGLHRLGIYSLVNGIGTELYICVSGPQYSLYQQITSIKNA